ncbi:patatin-like phospholipase family protein [Paraburkholderia fungorum]|uniref:patatin-like phospholipase family protein n=1 Tax=Paraburkholderia fungorum TaxID=134537 RepID=UPI001C1E9764|nr:patatin-like phospholipase family protein [Paraburkholderia fungorum]MBU7436531.1 patatin-like phospholipase family protein [Paraburkholderia fungorum]
MKPIRVALSGSGFLLPAHVGALRAVESAGFSPIEYAGTSGGSIVAMLAAAGMNLADLEKLALTFDWSPMMSFSLINLARMKSYSSGQPLLDFLMRETGGMSFRGLSVQLKIMASNIGTKAPFVFSNELTPDAQIALAARASACIPGIYDPVIIGNAILFDGGMVNNMPSDILVRDEVPRIGVDLLPDQTPMLPEDYSMLKALPRFIDMLLSSSEDAHISEGEASGVKIIQVNTGDAKSLDRTMCFATRQRLFSAGYETTLDALNGL